MFGTLSISVMGWGQTDPCEQFTFPGAYALSGISDSQPAEKMGVS